MKRAAIVVLIVAACRPSGDGAPDASASPQASAEPAPLAAAPSPSPCATPALPEGGPPPQPMRGDERLAADALRERDRDRPPTVDRPDGGRERESVGFTLSALLRPADVPAPLRAPEVNQPGIDAARKKTDLRLAIDMNASRLRIALEGSGWVLPPETELRARSDRYGHIVVMPGLTKYRPLPPGSMRALLGERRYDVAPISSADVLATPEAGKRISIKTRKAEVATRAAKATVEIGKLEALGEGGVLLCRWLLDLMNAPPQTALCAQDELPMRAELRWTGHGSLVFEVTGVLRKTDLGVAPLLVPPSNAELAADPLPAGAEILLTPAELAALRTGPIDLVPPPTGEALLLSNATVQLRMLYLDGVPIAWVGPGARDAISGLQRGRYVAQWRTFLGDTLEPPFTVTAPGVAQLGGADAGAK